MTALGLSVVLNGLILVVIGGISLHSEIFGSPAEVVATPEPPSENVVMVFPEKVPEIPQDAAPEKTRFARTSADQAAPRPEKPAFIGERDTQATSDRTPDPGAPPLPSQAGVSPKTPDDLETTESDYQDGKIEPAATSPATPPAAPQTATSALQNDPAPAENTSNGQITESPAADTQLASPPLRERLMDGPNPVDTPVPREKPEPEAIKETPASPPRGGQAQAANPSANTPKSTPQPPPKDPSFSGFQRKAAIQGSISRTGRSALNVANTPLGRYQAIISRAVEQEWQRNCVRHRDFITPGFLTVRFFVEPSGRVRTVQFVGDMETGEVQKGFTLNSIRDAEIPAMPQSLRKEYTSDPLELIFNFYF